MAPSKKGEAKEKEHEMKKNLYALSASLLLAAAWSVSSYADCTIVGSISIREGETTQVRVYAENKNGGNGALKFSGALKRGQKIRISGTDRIRYEYKYSGDSQFHSNTGAWCKNNEDVKIP